MAPVSLAQLSKPVLVQLLHYFAGKWKAETGRDTVLTAEDKAFGNGLAGSIRLQVNGR